MILNPFDPWKSSQCNCPAKMSLNPYTGCPHGCLYCYASSYVPRFRECRPKADLLKGLEREARKVKPGILVAMSNSSDPYPPLEKELLMSRGCLQILKDRGIPVQVVTKSDLVTRDLDLLECMDATVAITITTLRPSLSRLLEQGAPPPESRLEAIRRSRSRGIPVSARIDPLIPGLNDSEIEDLVSAVCRAGAEHITSSTYKARPDSLKRICSAFPDVGDSLKALLQKGSRSGKSQYLPLELRRGLMQKVEKNALEEGATFSACREGSAPKAGVHCDGSHLLACKYRRSTTSILGGYRS